MQRKDFLRNSMGLLGASSLLLDACKKDGAAALESLNTESADAALASCITSPAETAGPFPYPGGEINNPLNRMDITEGKTGIPLHLTFNVVNTNNNCAPVSNVRVDIWHCDKDGYYSGYMQNGYLGQINYTGQTFLRGFQVSDANGQVKFTTIYPGWYPGRITHIHIEAFINGVLKKITQVAFPDKANKKAYTTSLYKPHGQNTTVVNNLADGVFADTLASELLSITSYSAADGVNAAYTIGLAL